jgi:hypothetical protein
VHQKDSRKEIMSGGHFDYNQYYIVDIIDELDRLIKDNDTVAGQQYSPEVIKEFKQGLKFLRKAFKYSMRIDWLVSGDDGEDSFLKKLHEK